MRTRGPVGPPKLKRSPRVATENHRDRATSLVREAGDARSCDLAFPEPECHSIGRSQGPTLTRSSRRAPDGPALVVRQSDCDATS